MRLAAGVLVLSAAAACGQPAPVVAPTSTPALPAPPPPAVTQARPARGEAWVTQAWLDREHIETAAAEGGIVPRTAVLRLAGQDIVFARRRSRPDGRVVFACVPVAVSQAPRDHDVRIAPAPGATGVPSQVVDGLRSILGLFEAMGPPPAECHGPPRVDDWAVIGQSAGAQVYVERALYVKPGADRFFVHVVIVNQTDVTVGLDLSRYFETLYPNQWGASSAPHRGVIDEIRAPLPPLDEPARARLTESFHHGGTTFAAPYREVDYYRDFNASTRADVEAQSWGARYVLLVMDGHLDLTDGTRVDRILPPADDAEREVAIDAPVAWKDIPPSANVLVDR